MSSRVRLVSYEDWVLAYVDGRLVSSDHGVRIGQILEGLGVGLDDLFVETPEDWASLSDVERRDSEEAGVDPVREGWVVKPS
jgi:hypothetical protein